MMNDIVTTIEIIKQDIQSTRNRILENANNELINMYFRIGKVISENSKYGNQFIENLSVALRIDFPNATGFSKRNLARMKKFYEEYKAYPILPPAVAKLPWTHNCILIDKIKPVDKRIWYAQKTLQNGNSAIQIANKKLPSLYYSIGKYISQKTRTRAWGTSAVQAISDQLHGELPWLRGFSPSAIKRMCTFYEQWQVLENRPLTVGDLGWKDFFAISFTMGVATYKTAEDVRKVLPSEEELRRIINQEF